MQPERTVVNYFKKVSVKHIAGQFVGLLVIWLPSALMLCKNPQTVVTPWEAVAQLCHFMNIFLPSGAFLNTVRTGAIIVLRTGQRI